MLLRLIGRPLGLFGILGLLQGDPYSTTARLLGLLGLVVMIG